jgi:hypothetical protein
LFGITKKDLIKELVKISDNTQKDLKDIKISELKTLYKNLTDKAHDK